MEQGGREKGRDDLNGRHRHRGKGRAGRACQKLRVRKGITQGGAVRSGGVERGRRCGRAGVGMGPAIGDSARGKRGRRGSRLPREMRRAGNWRCSSLRTREIIATEKYAADAGDATRGGRGRHGARQTWKIISFTGKTCPWKSSAAYELDEDCGTGADITSRIIPSFID